MPLRPLAAYRLRPVHKQVVRKSMDADLITLLTDSEPLSIRSMKKPMRVLKDSAMSDTRPTGTADPVAG
ncbi:MAG: hypothetical protein ABL894_13680 [Hyphomicrobium sp.]